MDGFNVGDRITGRDATHNRYYTGTVAEVFPAAEAYRNRYRVVDTGEFYGNGSPIEPILVTAAPAVLTGGELDRLAGIDPYDEDV